MSTQNPSNIDILLYWILNVSAAFMLSAAHNVLFFVLDIRTIITHFLHYFFTFIFLFCSYSRLANIKVLPLTLKKSLIPPVISQIIVSLLTARVHAGNRTGSLYLIRIFDFLATITALKVAPKLLGPSWRNRVQWPLMLCLTISASMSWMEFGHLEYDGVGFFLAPFLAIAQGINVVILKKSYKTFISSSPQASFEIFSLFHSGLVSIGLALPALISYLKSVITYDASWEIIDYVLISMSVVFMACYKFSEYWLIFNTDLSVYFCLEHTKFFIGSIGQWFLQNMAHASIYALVGKMIFVTSSIQFWQTTEKIEKKVKHVNTE